MRVMLPANVRNGCATRVAVTMISVSAAALLSCARAELTIVTARIPAQTERASGERMVVRGSAGSGHADCHGLGLMHASAWLLTSRRVRLALAHEPHAVALHPAGGIRCIAHVHPGTGAGA